MKGPTYHPTSPSPKLRHTVALMHAQARPGHGTRGSTRLVCAGGRWPKCGRSDELDVDKTLNPTGEPMSGGRAAVVDPRA